jgi:hypothetical protein
MNMDDLSNLKQGWDGRKQAIVALLVFIAVLLVSCLGGAFVLAFLGKFGFVFSTFLITFVVCSFISLLGIIGSWIFGAKWEQKDFLDILPQIMPHINKD